MPKVAAIVPALNEEKNVGEVLRILSSCGCFNEVILVDDGSTDNTAGVGKSLGVKVIKIGKNSGKGNAMIEGVKNTDAQIIFFSDADLVGLTREHIVSIIEPMLKENFAMCVGLRNRLANLPKLIAKIDPLLAIGGERAVKKEIFERIPKNFLQGFAVETALNYFCLKNKLPVKYILLPKLGMVIKEKKWGLIKGFVSRMKMFWQILKIRLLIALKAYEF